MKYGVTGLLTFTLLFLLFPTVLHAQMFSVQEGADQDRSFAYTSFMAGWEAADFTFTGEPDESIDRFDFNDGIFKIRFESPGLAMYLGLAGTTTGLDDRNYLNVGASLSSQVVLGRSENERLWLLMPLQLNTDLKRVQATGVTNRFQQSTFQLGAGLGGRATFSERVNAAIQLIPNFGFSNSQGAFFGGTVFTLEGSARLYLESIFPNNAIVLGYNYRYKRYMIDADFFNYDFEGHSLSVGLTF